MSTDTVAQVADTQMVTRILADEIADEKSTLGQKWAKDDLATVSASMIKAFDNFKEKPLQHYVAAAQEAKKEKDEKSFRQSYSVAAAIETDYQRKLKEIAFLMNARVIDNTQKLALAQKSGAAEKEAATSLAAVVAKSESKLSKDNTKILKLVQEMKKQTGLSQLAEKDAAAPEVEDELKKLGAVTQEELKKIGKATPGSLLETGPVSKVYSDKNQYSFMGWFNTLNLAADPETAGLAKLKDCYDYRSYALKVVRNLGTQALNGAFVYNFWSSVASGVTSNVDSDPEISAAAQMSCKMLAPVFKYSSFILESLDMNSNVDETWLTGEGSQLIKDHNRDRAYMKALLSTTGGSGLGALCGAMREKTALATTDSIGLGFSGAKLPGVEGTETKEVAEDDKESRFLASQQTVDRRSKRQLEMSQEAAEAFNSVLLRSVDWHAVDKDSQKVGKALGALRQATDPVRRQLSSETKLSPVLFQELMKAQEDTMDVVTEALDDMRNHMDAAQKNAHSALA